MLLVYTHKITPRVKYAFKHICTRILGIPVSFTTTIEEFIAHDTLKLSYTKQPLSHEFFIQSHELLFEQGLNDLEIQVQPWDTTKGFFATGEKSELPFDIFAASFYLLSRYEEYLPHVPDAYGRYDAEESIAFKNHFLQQPVVDVWAYKFKTKLQKKFPEVVFPKKEYTIKPIIDVPIAYYFKQKGLLRTLARTLTDLVEFKFKKIYTRFLVLIKLKKDPYDTYKYIINKQKKYNYKFIFFFLLGDYSSYDKNINSTKRAYISLIKQIADYSLVGLKISYFAISDVRQLKKEKLRLETITNRVLKATRNSYSKLNLPETYRNLIDLEIKEDYTMGYTNYLGFRAGTCTPFLFYDLDYEIQTPLELVPYSILDFALLKHHSYLDKKKAVNQIITEIKNVNGLCVPVFHNYTFSDLPKWKTFKDLFNEILESNANN